MLLTVIIWILLAVQVLLLGAGIVIVYFMARGIFGVPWVRTNHYRAITMLDHAGLRAGERVVDFGSGDGAIVIEAARIRGATGVGYEHLWLLVQWAKIRARWYRVHHRVVFYHENFFRTDRLPQGDIVTSYLFPEVNALLEPLLLRDYPSGTRVVSRTFPFPTLPLTQQCQIEGETYFFYKIP